jgi:putative peptidoglycan lipid II flippase
LSRVFGANLVLDAFFFAFMVPNLFRRLFGEGAFAAAFLPVYARLERDDPAVARQLASQSVALLMIVLGGLVVLLEVTLFAISAAGGHRNLALWLMMVMLPYMPLVCLVAVLGAMLQVHRRFGPTAAAPIILNLAMITAAIVAGAVLAPIDDRGRALHIGWVAVSVVLAGVVQMAWSLWAQPDQQWWQGFRARAGEPMRRVIPCSRAP